jgi:hypothetical protein
LTKTFGADRLTLVEILCCPRNLGTLRPGFGNRLWSLQRG